MTDPYPHRKDRSGSGILVRTFLLVCAVFAGSPPVHAAEWPSLAAAMAGAGMVPVPPAERELDATLAGRAIAVPGAPQDLEGPCWEANGDLVFSDVQGGRVLRLKRGGRIETVVTLSGLQPGGLALDHGGRIFIAAAGPEGGAILAMHSDGTAVETIVPESAGFMPNDLVFDAEGGFYFTDARGTVGDPAGGVWYVPADTRRPVPVVRNLMVANGIALDPDGKRLWVGEYGLGRLYRLDLKDATTVKPFGASVAYQFTGPAPDSMRTDAAGNVYVALYGQGRILIFSRAGLPTGQILLPGRAEAHDLNLTSMAIRPDGHLVIVSSDGEGGRGAFIWEAAKPSRVGSSHEAKAPSDLER